MSDVADDNLRERLLRVQDLNLEGAVRMCRATETTKERMKEIKLEEKEIHAVKSKNHPKLFKQKHASKSFVNKGYPKEKQKQCKRCGEMHGKDCPAKGQTCKKCGKRDHYAKMCFTRKKKVNEKNDFNDSSEYESDDFFCVHSERS